MSDNPLADLQHQLWAAEDRIGQMEAERDRVFAGELVPGKLALRLAVLERDRELLLAYVRAQDEMEHADYDTMTDAEADRIGYGVRNTRRALIGAGLLEGDDQ